MKGGLGYDRVRIRFKFRTVRFPRKHLLVMEIGST